MSLDSTLSELADQAKLDEGDRSLLWAAYHGEAELQRAMGGEQVGPPPTAVAAATAPVWLSSVAVEGFRGIGPRTELLLNPKPGLTLVVGRNGSGKSSFAEGLEALLTGDNLRWRDRPTAWQSGWQNLHHTAKTQVEGEFQQEGETAITHVSRQFGDSFEDSTVSCDRGGDKMEFEALGWEDPLTNYKPFLSYNELGSMLEQKPSAIYDSMAGVLGLERLTDARNRLRQARLNAEKPAKELAKTRKALLESLASVAKNAEASANTEADENTDSKDSRAADAIELLKARQPDLERLEVLAFGDDNTGAEPLTAIAQLALLDTDRYAALAKALTDAGADYQRLATTDAATSDRVAGLLRQALDHHRHDGDGLCPVCGQGTLDQQWQTKAEQEATALETSAAALQGAERALDSARSEALAALGPLPAPLTALQPAESTDPGGGPADELARDLPAVRERWNEWVAPPADGWTDDVICDRLADAADINGVIEGVRSVATDAVAAHDADWRPVAEQILAWIGEFRRADSATATAKRVGEIEDIYKTAEANVRTERFQPIADRSAKLWEGLRQKSNVNLERVSLEGQTTQRRVDLDVTVDGSATSALGVMSQGELHALALALFLPRVTAPESPFRFLVVDDPVQAMDPARVDGLARVLNSVAEDRQVIVFTHDDRLPSACRRLDLSADIIEITRQPESRVSASFAEHPAEKAIGDAYALAKTERLPPSLKRQIVPIHCRRAIESQVQDLTWRRLLRDGRTHDAIEQLIDDADTTAALLSLFLFGDDRSPREVYERIDQLVPGSSGQLNFLNKAVHEAPDDLNPEALTGTIRKLSKALREMPLPA